MKTLLIAAALALPLGTSAQSTAPAGQAGFHARLYERYCEKLREGPEAYVQFVRRLYTVHRITYSDFAPERPGDPVLADCRVSPERVAAVRGMLESAKR